MRDEGSVLRNE
jgi:hypothetical protein